jgi:hypothetical protein
VFLNTAFSSALEQLTCAQFFLDMMQQTAVAAVYYGAAIQPGSHVTLPENCRCIPFFAHFARPQHYFWS